MGMEGQVRGCGGFGVAVRLGTGAGSRGWAPSFNAAGAALDPRRAPELHQPRTRRHSPAAPNAEPCVPKHQAPCPQGPSSMSPSMDGAERLRTVRPRVPRHRARHPSALWPPSSASPSPKPHGPKPGVPKHQARCPEQVFCPQTPRPRPQHWNTLSRGQLRVGSPHRGHQHGADTGCGDPSGATPRPLCPPSPSRGAGTHRDGGRRWEPAAL